MSEKYLRIIDEQKKIINDLNLKLVKCESARSHFLSNIRNEIINPFASIHGLAKLIVQSQKEEWKKVITIASMIHKESFLLDFQLMNIFSVAELESGETVLNFYNSNLSDLFKTEISNYAVYAKKKSITLEIKHQQDNDVFVVTDMTKLKVILVNLLMNAINFSNNDSKVIIECNLSAENINFSVQDFGIGLSYENRGKFFNRFSKENSEINSINIGLGLGLSVIASYLELFNGEINIESELGNGAKFSIQIPIPNIDKSDLDTAISENEFFFDDEIF